MTSDRRIRKKGSLTPALMMSYTQLNAAFAEEVPLDELQGAIEHLLDAVKAEARIKTHSGSRNSPSD